MLTEDNVIADRLIPGELGGTYRRSNIKGPHCMGCSCRQGARRTAEIARAKAAIWDDSDHCVECRKHWSQGHHPD